MLKNYRTLLVLGAFLTLGFHQNTYAAGSGALRDETPDAGAFGMGSAFVGEADTPAAVYYNPAGMNQITNPSITVGDTLIAPQYDYRSFNGTSATDDRRIYNVPDFYAVTPVTSRLALGAGIGSYWGLGDQFGNGSILKYDTTAATLTNSDYMLAASYKVTDRWSVAASLDNDYSALNESAEINLSAYHLPDATSELKENSDAWGYRLATMFKINDQNQVGLMYRSRIDHTYSGNAYVDGFEALGLSSNSYETRVKEKVTLPQSFVIGYDLKITPRWKINIDAEWFDWSIEKKQLLNFPNASPSDQAVLANFATVPEDWKSTWSEAIGTEYAVTDKFRVRAGYFHHNSVGPDQNFDPVLPDMNSDGFTTGFGYDFTKHLTLNVAYSFGIYDPRKIYTDPSYPTGATDAGEYREIANFGSASLTYKF